MNEAVPSNAALPDWLDDIHDFVTELRGPDFRIGIAEEVRAVQVLDFLRRQHDVPQTPDGIAMWLGPVFCTNARQQASLRLRLRDWAERHGSATQSDGRRAPPAPATPEPVRKLRVAASVDRWMVYVGIVALVALIGFGLLRVVSQSQRAGTDVAVTSATPGSTVAFPKPAVAAGLVVGAVPLLGWLGFIAWRRRRPEALARRFTAASTPGRNVSFAAAKRLLFIDSGLSHHFQALRRHAEIPSDAIDVQRTLRATIRAGGRVELRYGTRRRLPDYLLLVDRISVDDHLGSLADVVMKRMTVEQVPFTCYEFHGDPRRARLHATHAAGHRVADLSDLAALHGDHPLVLFTDADRFFIGTSDRPHAWLTQLLEWPMTIIFTTKPRNEWARREQCLQALGFALMPATSSGIAGFADLLRGGNRETAPLPGRTDTRRLWQLLGARPDRWIRSTPPDQKDIERLVGGLQDALSPAAFTVLCATAVFPAISAEVTLWLADRLIHAGEAPFDEASFCQLARLPWLRRGSMPDWLRAALIDRLGSDRQAEVRDLCFQLLRPASRAGENFQLEIARNDQPVWIATLLAVLRHDRESVLRDQLFLGFVRSEDRTGLAVDAPEELSRLLRPQLAKADVGAAIVCVLAAVLLYEFSGSIIDLAKRLFGAFAASGIAAQVEFTARIQRKALPPTVLAEVVAWHVMAWAGQRAALRTGVLVRAVLITMAALVTVLSLTVALVLHDTGDWAMALAAAAASALLAAGGLDPGGDKARDPFRLFRSGTWLGGAATTLIGLIGLYLVARYLPELIDALEGKTYPLARGKGLDFLGDLGWYAVCGIFLTIPFAAAMAHRLRLTGSVTGTAWAAAVVAMVFVTGIEVAAFAAYGPFADASSMVLSAIGFSALPLAGLWGASIVLWRAGAARSGWVGTCAALMSIGWLLPFGALWFGGAAFAALHLIAPLMLFVILLRSDGRRMWQVRSALGALVIALPSAAVLWTNPLDAVVPSFVAFLSIWPALRIARPELWSARVRNDTEKRPVWGAWTLAPLMWLLCISYDFGIFRFGLSYLCIPIAAWWADRFGRRGLPALIAGTFLLLIDYNAGPLQVGGGAGIFIACIVIQRLVTDRTYLRDSLRADSLTMRQMAFLLLGTTCTIRTTGVAGFSLSFPLHEYLLLLLLLIGMSNIRLHALPLLLAAGLAFGLLMRFLFSIEAPIPLYYGIGDPSALVACLTALYLPRLMRRLATTRLPVAPSSTMRASGAIGGESVVAKSRRSRKGLLPALPYLLLITGFVAIESGFRIFLPVDRNALDVITNAGLMVIALLIGWFDGRRGMAVGIALIAGVTAVATAATFPSPELSGKGAPGAPIQLQYFFSVLNAWQGAFVTSAFLWMGAVLARRAPIVGFTAHRNAEVVLSDRTGEAEASKPSFPPLTFAYFDYVAIAILGVGWVVQVGMQLAR
ncbi:MAG: hypothetical protein ABI277_12810 [Burkholderiaceae bacterium]